MTYEVVIKTVLEQLIAAARRRTTLTAVSEEIGPLLAHPWEFLKERPHLQTHGRNVAIYWGTPAGVSIEVGVEVGTRFEDQPEAVCSATPAGTVAMCVHFGPYDQLGEAHQAVRQWCAAADRELATPNWELYGHWEEDPARLRTDVLYILKKRR